MFENYWFNYIERHRTVRKIWINIPNSSQLHGFSNLLVTTMYKLVRWRTCGLNSFDMNIRDTKNKIFIVENSNNAKW